MTASRIVGNGRLKDWAPPTPSFFRIVANTKDLDLSGSNSLRFFVCPDLIAADRPSSFCKAGP